MLSCGLSSSHLKGVFFSLLGDDRVSIEQKKKLSQFSTCQPPNVLLQKPDRRPPQVTGRRVSTVHQGGVGAPNELATSKVHGAVVDFVERSV